MHAEALEEKRESETLELELQAAGGGQMCVLGTEEQCTLLSVQDTLSTIGSQFFLYFWPSILSQDIHKPSSDSKEIDFLPPLTS